MDSHFNKNELYPDCPIRNILNRISDKWTLLVLYTLNGHESLRFKDLTAELTDISERMLVLTLRTLETDGFVGLRRSASAGGVSPHRPRTLSLPHHQPAHPMGQGPHGRNSPRPHQGPEQEVIATPAIFIPELKNMQKVSDADSQLLTTPTP